MAILSPEATVLNLLLNSSSVTALTGPRISALAERPKPSTAYPLTHITIRAMGAEDYEHMGGGSELIMTVIRIESYAPTYPILMSLHTAVRNALHTKTGSLTVGSDTVTIQGITLDNYVDTLLEPKSNQEKGIYIRTVDADVWTNISIPTGS